MRFTVENVGLCRVKIPSLRALEEVDEEWPSLRREADAHHHWLWADIAERSGELFALTNEVEKIVAILGGKGILRLPGGPCYRLDYLEVYPPHRGTTDLGYLAIALGWERAAELGCGALIAGSLPETAHIFEGMGGERRCMDGWQVESGLVAFVFSGACVERFSALVEELSDEG